MVAVKVVVVMMMVVVVVVVMVVVIRWPLSYPLHLVDGEGALRRLLLVTSAPVDLHIICYHKSFISYYIANITLHCGEVGFGIWLSNTTEEFEKCHPSAA